MGSTQLAWKELAPRAPQGTLPGSALPSISIAHSWPPFCTGAGAGPSNSSASRSSRSSLLCRRLKTRRWSWEVREKGPGGSSGCHPRSMLAHSFVTVYTHTHTRLPSGLQACPGPAHSDSSFQDSLCLHTEPRALHLVLKSSALPSPVFHPKF